MVAKNQGFVNSGWWDSCSLLSLDKERIMERSSVGFFLPLCPDMESGHLSSSKERTTWKKTSKSYPQFSKIQLF